MDPERSRQFELFIGEGYSIKKAARMAGVSETWATNHVKDMKTGGHIDTARQRAHRQRLVEGKALGRPRRYDELCPEAKRAFNDFDYFRRRYMGHISTPWQAMAGQKIGELLATESEEFVVMNEPPGTGKSTWLVDLFAWLIVRDRSIRTVMGSATLLNAKRQVSRLRRTLERETPVTAKLDEVRRGLACDAESTLAADFGVFRPLWQAEVWRSEEFVVVQADEQAIDEKEPTCSAVGMDTGFLGNRYNLIGWDDVVTRKSLLTIEAIEKQRDWWDEEAESRLEPGGLMLLVGQRMASNDLYRYSLDKEGGDDEGEAKQYHHIVYPAHHEESCKGEHELDSPAWPEGCLLDPKRASWRKLSRLKVNQPRVYAVQFQQEDADPEAALVQRLWIEGGRDVVTGERFTGCWDEDRPAWKANHPDRTKIVYVTVDTSPTKYWAIQAWCWYPHDNQIDMLAGLKIKMTADEFLDRKLGTGESEFIGLMPEWTALAQSKGLPIDYWIVEGGSATSGHWLLTSRVLAAFRQKHRELRIIEHYTSGVNKTDDNFGIPMVREWWRSGSIRLPGAGRDQALPLVGQVTTYPNATSDDQVLSHWFGIHNMKRMSIRAKVAPTQRRPGFAADLAKYRPLSMVRTG